MTDIDERLNAALSYRTKNVCVRPYYPRKVPGEVTLYAIRCGSFVKFGYASNLKKRFESYLTHNPFKCEVLCFKNLSSVNEARATEKAIARELRGFHHYGEWYSVDLALFSYVKQKYYS